MCKYTWTLCLRDIVKTFLCFSIVISLYFGGYSLCLIAEEEVSVIILIKKKWNYLYLIELVATSSINFSWQVFPNIIHYNTNKTHQMYSLFILKCNHLHLVSLDAYA